MQLGKKWRFSIGGPQVWQIKPGLLYANNKNVDQCVHLHNLISTFVILFLAQKSLVLVLPGRLPLIQENLKDSSSDFSKYSLICNKFRTQ